VSKHNLTKRIEELYNNYLALKMELDDSDERIAELERSLLELAVKVAEFIILLEKHCLDEVVKAVTSSPPPEDALSPPEPEAAPPKPEPPPLQFVIYVPVNPEPDSRETYASPIPQGEPAPAEEPGKTEEEKP
jgi:hypothetical protein